MGAAGRCSKQAVRWVRVNSASIIFQTPPQLCPPVTFTALTSASVSRRAETTFRLLPLPCSMGNVLIPIAVFCMWIMWAMVWLSQWHPLICKPLRPRQCFPTLTPSCFPTLTHQWGFGFRRMFVFDIFSSQARSSVMRSNNEHTGRPASRQLLWLHGRRAQREMPPFPFSSSPSLRSEQFILKNTPGANISTATTCRCLGDSHLIGV